MTISFDIDDTLICYQKGALYECNRVPLFFVINQHRYEQHIGKDKLNLHPSKNPNNFGIDLHIDDSKGVKIEGDHYGFDVIVVDPR